MDRSRRWRRRRAAVAAGVALTAWQVHAATSLDLDVGAEHSDNIARAPTHEQSDTIASAGLRLGTSVDRPRLDANIDARLRYQEYLDDTFDSELVGGLDGQASYAFVPERFLWVVQDNYGQIANNRQVVDTPANRQDFNFFSTGPDLTLPIGGRTALRVSGRWSDIYYETSLQNAQTLEESVSLERRLSQTNTVSLVASNSDSNYDRDDLFPDSSIREAFLRYAMTGRRTTLTADAGFTEAEQAGETNGGALGRLSVSYQITPRSNVRLDLGSQFADTADTFRQRQDILGVDPGTESVVASSDVFRTSYAFVVFSTQRERTGLSASLGASQERHETQTFLDRDTRQASVTLTRRLSSRVELDVGANFQSEDFDAGTSFDEWSAGTGLRWRLGRALSVRFRLDHFEGSGVGRDYDELRAFAGVGYSFSR